MKEEYITMSTKEVERLKIIQTVVDKRLKQKKAAQILGVSARQIIRLVKKFKKDGPAGLVSKHRGKPGNHAHPKAFKDEVIGIIKKEYYDFGPTLASEKLEERNNIKISIESTRQLMIQAGLWEAKKEKLKVIHPSRLRRACYGELIQIDGSPHDWFEERGPRCTLLVFIDDATSRIQLMRFVLAETTFAYFNAMKLYIQRYGKPVSLYADKLGVFKVNAKEAETGTGLTQFGRAMEELGIELIHAHSAEAKGRVERANETLQDRLIKELRLQGISDMETGNQFLDEHYTEYHNVKFAVPPRDSTNVHVTFDDFSKMDLSFTLQDTRIVSKTLTVRYKGRLLQINVPGKGYRLRQAKVTVCEYESGEITLRHNGQSLSYTLYDRKQQYREAVTAKELDTKPLKTIRIHRGHKPAANHPWKTPHPTRVHHINHGRKPKILDDSVGYLDIWEQ